MPLAKDIISRENSFHNSTSDDYTFTEKSLYGTTVYYVSYSNTEVTNE